MTVKTMKNKVKSFLCDFLERKKKVEKNPFCNLAFANYLNNVVLSHLLVVFPSGLP